MRVTRALTELADTAVAGRGRLPAARRGAARPVQAARRGAAGSGLRLHRARDGQDGRLRTQLFERHRSHRVLRPGRAVADSGEAAAVLRAHHARAGEAAAGAHRRRLCVPRRSAAASRSGLDPDRGVDRRRRSNYYEQRRPELGARGDDQGAALRRRHRRRRGAAQGACRRSSGASISTSPRSPTSRR